MKRILIFSFALFSLQGIHSHAAIRAHDSNQLLVLKKEGRIPMTLVYNYARDDASFSGYRLDVREPSGEEVRFVDWVKNEEQLHQVAEAVILGKRDPEKYANNEERLRDIGEKMRLVVRIVLPISNLWLSGPNNEGDRQRDINVAKDYNQALDSVVSGLLNSSIVEVSPSFDENKDLFELENIESLLTWHMTSIQSFE